jgi:hypothetical protein
MPNEQLLQYLRDNYGKATRQELTQSLMSAGWQLPDIAAAYEAAEREHTAATAPAGQTAGSVPAAAVGQPETPNTTFLAEMERRRQPNSQPTATTPLDTGANLRALNTARAAQSASSEKGIIGFLMRTGLVKSAQQANIAMIGIVVACLALTAWLLLPTSGGGGASEQRDPDAVTGS